MSAYSFFSLPDELLKSVISEWSNHKSQCCLDSATSAIHCRHMLSRLFSFQPGLFTQKSMPRLKSYVTYQNLQINYFRWLKLKKIYLCSLKLLLNPIPTMYITTIIGDCCNYVRKLVLIEPRNNKSCIKFTNSFECCAKQHSVMKSFRTIIDRCILLTDLTLEIHSARSVLSITKAQSNIIAQLTTLTIYLCCENYTSFGSYPKELNFNLYNLQTLRIYGNWNNQSKLYKNLILNLPKTLDCLYIPGCSIHLRRFVELMEKYPSLTILNSKAAYYNKKTNEVIYF
jgi:hypothetical protein